MNDNITTVSAAFGAILGAFGVISPDIVAQWISALASLGCLAFALIRSAIRVYDLLRARRAGEKTTEQVLKELDNIQDEIRKGGKRDE